MSNAVQYELISSQEVQEKIIGTGGHMALSGPFERSPLPKTRRKWLEMRKTGLGGSDCGPVMGYSKWGSPLTVYGDKLSPVPQEIDESVELPQFRRGRVLEPVIMKEFQTDWMRDDGRDIRVSRYPYFLRSKAFPFMVANLDGLIQIQGLGVGVLEIKTTNSMNAKEWANGEVPDAYYFQVMHYLIVTGLLYALVVVWIDGDIQWRLIERNEEWIQKIIEREKQVWQMILDKEPPAPSGLAAEDDVIRELEGGLVDHEIEIDPVNLPMVDAYKTVTAQINEAKKYQKVIKQRLRMCLEGNQKGKIGSHKISVKTISPKRFANNKFKVDHPDMYEEYSEVEPYERIDVR